MEEDEAECRRSLRDEEDGSEEDGGPDDCATQSNNEPSATTAPLRLPTRTSSAESSSSEPVANSCATEAVAHSSPHEPRHPGPSRFVKLVEAASFNPVDLELRRQFSRVSADHSDSIFVSFGGSGLILMATLMCITLVSGTIVVWWSTGITTQPVVDCLVGLHQAEFSARVGDRLDAMFGEAQSALDLALAAPSLIANRSASAVARAPVPLVRLLFGSSPSPDAVAYLTAIATAFPAFTLHVARAG